MQREQANGLARPSLSRRRLWALSFGVLLFLGGCGDDDDAGVSPTATPAATSTPRPADTATSMPEATATPSASPTTPLLGGEDTPTPTIDVPGPESTSTPTPSIDVPGPEDTSTPTTTPTSASGIVCSTAADTCSGTSTTVVAISHSYTDPEGTILYRVKIAAASTGTAWGDGNNGFFYQVLLGSDGGDAETLTYVPFNGIGAGSDGQPELPQFWFIVPADQSYTTMAVSLCASSYLADSGSTPSCTATMWTDTYSTLPAPSVGDPPFDSVTLQIAGTNSTQVTVPNNGVYPGVVTLDVSGSDLDDDDIEWLYDHLVFFDEDGDPYTNDLFTDSSESARSIGVLSIDEAAYQDPTDGTYRTKYGSTDSIEKVDSPDRQFFFYTRDILGTSAIDVGINYIYDQSNDCRGYTNQLGSKDACSDSALGATTSGSVGFEPKVGVLPESGQSGALSADPQDNIQAGEEENRTITFELTTSSLCTKVANPLAISASGEAYNQPDYVIDGSSGTWGMSFPRGLYYVLPTGFGNCDSTTTPFCHLTSEFTAYVPHYANSNGAFGTRNGGSTTASTVGSIALADQYALGSPGLTSSNALIWFDNCGYGYIYEECAACDYPLGTRLNLPDPPDDGDKYEYTVTNSLSFPIVFGKECCSSYYQQNQNTGAYEPPSQLDDSFGAFIPAGGSLSYGTLFSDEEVAVYNAATGVELFKLRLNADSPAVYSCGVDDWSVTVGDTAPYAVEIAESGAGALECGTVGLCPFGMTASTDGDTVTCTLTESSFILGMSDWAADAELVTDAIQVRAWGGTTTGCDSGSPDGGFALTVQMPAALDQDLYAYIGQDGSCFASSGTALTTTPLSAIGETDAQEITDPSGLALAIAGGAGTGGDYASLAGSTGDGGAGGTAIANADPNGDAVSGAGKGGQNSSGFPCEDSTGGDGGNADGLGSGGNHDGKSGLGGESGNGEGWKSGGSLILPDSWSAGKGGSNANTGYGGGGFGGGGAGGDNTCSTAGGGGGGSWAAANTVYDSTAPTTAPDSPNGNDGTVQFVYTQERPCSFDYASSGVVIRCQYSSSEVAVDVAELVDMAAAVTGVDSGALPVYVEAWGGRGGKGASRNCGGSDTPGGSRGKWGYARSSHLAATLAAEFPELYIYVGAQGADGSGSISTCGGVGGSGGASTLVIGQALDADIAGDAPGDALVLLLAGGGGGSGGGFVGTLAGGMACTDGGDGRDGGVAIASTDADAAAGGGGLDGGSSGVGGCGTRSSGGCGGDGIGGLGGAAKDAGGSWLDGDLDDWTAGNGGDAVDCGGGGGGGWGGGQGGGVGTLDTEGGGAGGSYARMATIDDADAPLVGEDTSPAGGDGSVVLSFDPCAADSSLWLCGSD